MTASRIRVRAAATTPNTACPQRRSFVARDARRRGQACNNDIRNEMTAFGAALTTPAMLAGVDNARKRYGVIVHG
jgi:hypothetical protein